MFAIPQTGGMTTHSVNARKLTAYHMPNRLRRNRPLRSVPNMIAGCVLTHWKKKCAFHSLTDGTATTIMTIPCGVADARIIIPTIIPGQRKAIGQMQLPIKSVLRTIS